MKIFFKAQASSLVASLADLIVFICLAEILKIHYTVAIVFGAIAGAAINFLINRIWSFESTQQPVKQQSFKYLIVWVGSVLLNAAGTYLLTNFFKISYIVSKIGVAILVGLSFNYVLQKKYVFSVK